MAAMAKAKDTLLGIPRPQMRRTGAPLRRAKPEMVTKL
jgi:hypothetical protein